MKKIFKKNQIVITGLALLIAVAGYLNFANVDLGLIRTRRPAATAVYWKKWKTWNTILEIVR